MKRVSVLLLLVTAAFAQTRSRLAEYALVLEDPPVAQKAQSRVALQSAEAQAHLQKVRGAQTRVLAELAARKVRVSATSQILVNAIFVRVAPEQAAALQNIPGVKWIQYQPPSKPLLNAAVNLVGVPTAWSTVGGSANAGVGPRRPQPPGRRGRAHRPHPSRRPPDPSRIQGHRLPPPRRFSRGGHRVH